MLPFKCSLPRRYYRGNTGVLFYTQFPWLEFPLPAVASFFLNRISRGLSTMCEMFSVCVTGTWCSLRSALSNAVNRAVTGIMEQMIVYYCSELFHSPLFGLAGEKSSLLFFYPSPSSECVTRCQEAVPEVPEVLFSKNETKRKAF